MVLSTDTLWCALAVMTGACLQGAGGIGFALFAAPLVALVSPDLVPGPMIFLGGCVSLLAALRERQAIDYRAAAAALAGRVPGSLLAGLAMGLLPRSAFALLFAGLILGAVALSLSGWRIRASPLVMGGAGFASGFMGTITSVGTPPMGLVMQNMAPARLRATIGLFLVAGSAVSLAVLSGIGRFGWPEVQRSLLLLPALALGFWLSNPLRERIDATALRRLVLGVCALSALVLLWQHR
ncbi:sulfite exporter TauE/SafE family protein [Variovorax terrae]|uniref:Probable membrane transporter protein n=1 Tax=Variovorax terrae TaxID=2923278 RepID=A0A9X1VW95_9BURK|nr:sulfite exporter TauE/SafE family protein [Variovorax terrae]MCJ0764439.1 sulfite exporter TauE/SafE family protein [Variovorax terrae]